MAASIVSIIGLQNLPSLQAFYADYNGLQSVNLSGLTNLVTVDISDCDVPGTTTNSLTSVNLSGCTALTTLRLDDSEFSGGIPSLTGLTSLSTVNFGRVNSPSIIDMSGVVNLADADFFQNTNLTSLIIADTQPISYLGVRNCALTETAVDDILVTLSNNGVSNGEVTLDGGTSATPSATGLAAKTVLEGNGWTVSVN
jgi:Leucine-rich repeat (LRR) protein